jgi:hypothetical protein
MPVNLILSESYLLGNRYNITLIFSRLLVVGLQAPMFHKLCRHKGVFSVDSHLLDGGYSTRKLSQYPLVHWPTPSTRCSYRHFRCVLLLREDSYSSSAFPPCESQPIDLLMYGVGIASSMLVTTWTLARSCTCVLRSSVYNVKLTLDNAKHVVGTYFVLQLALRQGGLGMHSRNC